MFLSCDSAIGRAAPGRTAELGIGQERSAPRCQRTAPCARAMPALQGRGMAGPPYAAPPAVAEKLYGEARPAVEDLNAARQADGSRALNTPQLFGFSGDRPQRRGVR
jgi:hypothetical protein